MQNRTWPEAERLGAEGATGLVTLASLEQHGPTPPARHRLSLLGGASLPRDIAERLAGSGLVNLSVVRGGLSTHHLAFPGSVTVPPDAYRARSSSRTSRGSSGRGSGRVGVWSWDGGNFTFVRELGGDVRRGVAYSRATPTSGATSS